MREDVVRTFGLAIAASYGVIIVWMYVRQPQSVAEVTGGLTASVGAYRVNQQSFDEGLRFFRNDQFAAARLAFERADPGRQDARTRFYVAYTFYREGWGLVYHDDTLFALGLEAVDQAIALDPRGTLVVEDPGLSLRSPGELKGELEAGLRSDPSDLNPLNAFRRRR
jgi:hypothetical protein